MNTDRKGEKYHDFRDLALIEGGRWIEGEQCPVEYEVGRCPGRLFWSITDYRDIDGNLQSSSRVLACSNRPNEHHTTLGGGPAGR